MLTLGLVVTLGGLHGASLIEPSELQFVQGTTVAPDRTALRSRLELLEASRPPSVAVPTALLVIAVASAGIGVVSVVVGFLGGIVGGGAVFNTGLAIFLVGLSAGVVLGIIGGVLMGIAVGHRKDRTREIQELKEQLGPEPLAPPTQTPPAASGPQPALLLARF